MLAAAGGEAPEEEAPVAEPAPEPEIEVVPEPEPVPETESEPEPEPKTIPDELVQEIADQVKDEELPKEQVEEEEQRTPPTTYPAAWIHDDWKEPVRKGLPGIVVFLLVLIGLAILGLVAFVVLARVAPDFIDTLLYTPDELRIINY